MNRLARRRDLLLAVAIAGAVGAAFAPALSGDFLSFDDLQKLRYNPKIRGLGASELRWMWTTTYFGLYQPVAWLSWALDFAVWRFNPAGYHLTNVLCHAITALLVYRLAGRLFEFDGAAAGAPRGSRGLPAAAAALLFAVHPLRVEPVVWISARGDLLAGLSAVAATLAYLRAVQPGRASAPRRGWYAAAFGVFGAGLLAKPSAATLPLAWLVLDVFPLRRLAPGSGLRVNGRLLLEKLPFLAAAVGVTLLAGLAKAQTATMLPYQSRSPFGVAGQAAYSAVFYLHATIAPLSIAPLYERPSRLAMLTGPYLVSGFVGAGLTLVLLALRRRLPSALAAWLAYLVLLIPVSGLFSYGSQLVAARYSYVPCIPWALLAGATLRRLPAGGPGFPRARWHRGAAMTAMAAVLGALGMLSWSHARMWQDSQTLWTYALALAPDSVAIRVRLGVLAEARGDLAEGAEHFREALARWPGARLDESGLGAELEQQGHHVPAAVHYRNAFADDPDNRTVALALGRTLLLSGQTESAVRHLRGVLRRAPDFVDARVLLAAALKVLGDLDSAIAEARLALALDADSALAHYHLADALVGVGRVTEAAGHLRRALALDSRLADPASALMRRAEELGAETVGKGR